MLTRHGAFCAEQQRQPLPVVNLQRLLSRAWAHVLVDSILKVSMIEKYEAFLFFHVMYCVHFKICRHLHSFAAWLPPAFLLLPKSMPLTVC